MAFFKNLFAKEPEQLLKEAETHRSKGNYDKALSISSKLVEQAPENVAYLLERAYCHEALGFFDEADDDFTAVLNLRGEVDHKVLFARGITRVQNHKYEDAIDDFQRVAESDTEWSSDAWFNMALALQQVNKEEEALSCLLRATEGEAGNLRASYLLGCLFNNKEQYKDAVEQFSLILAQSPEITDCLFNRGFALFKLGQYAEALEDFDRIVALETAPGDALFYRGMCHHHLGESGPAIEDLEAAAQLGIEGAQKALDEHYPFE